MADDTKPGFVLAIVPSYDTEGELDTFQVQSRMQGLPKEYIFTVVRTWLRVHEAAYAKTFTEANI